MHMNQTEHESGKLGSKTNHNNAWQEMRLDKQGIGQAMIWHNQGHPRQETPKHLLTTNKTIQSLLTRNTISDALITGCLSITEIVTEIVTKIVTSPNLSGNA